MTEKQLADEIFSRYGAVTRARGCFLYTKKGTRLTDLYQAGGRAVLGWEGGSAFTKFKNILNRGITGYFITEYAQQIHKAVSSLLCAEYEVFFYTDYDKAFKAVRAFEPETKDFWKPWNPVSEKSAVVMVPPLSWTETLFLVCVKREVLVKNGAEALSKAVMVPAPLCGAVTRSIYDLMAALQFRQEKDWFLYDTVLTKFFTRKGPYLYPKMAEEKYSDFVKFCLDCGVVVNPDYNSPSLVPFGADKGVFTKLKNSEKGADFYGSV